MAQVVLFFGVW